MTEQFTTEPFSSLARAGLLGQPGYLPGSWQQPNLAMQVVSKTLTIWHNGAVVLRSPANTGMPSGHRGRDIPGVRKVPQHDHVGNQSGRQSLLRSRSVRVLLQWRRCRALLPARGYGFQHGPGCVELPFAQAKQAFPDLTFGSLVTVTG